MLFFIIYATRCNTKNMLFYYMLFNFSKCLLNFFILPDAFQVNYISVYCFHDIVAGPSSPLQNILVRYAYGVHNGCSIMPEVVKAEMGYINLFEYSSESVCDVIRVHINQLSFFSDIRSITNAAFLHPLYYHPF